MVALKVESSVLPKEIELVGYLARWMVVLKVVQRADLKDDLSVG